MDCMIYLNDGKENGMVGMEKWNECGIFWCLGRMPLGLVFDFV